MTSTPSWRRYVAIGDSFTEGMSDPDPQQPQAYRGWADRLAGFLARHAHDSGRSLDYANLAIRGRLISDIAGRQTDEALALRPDLVSIVGGANDCLRPSVDTDDVAHQLEQAVARLRATGADVLMATPGDPGWAPIMKHTRGRFAVHTANIWGIAQRHGATVVDMWTMPALRDVRMWAPDRIHLSSEGHRRVAAQAAWSLGLDPAVDWSTPLAPLPEPGRWEQARGHARWTQTYVGPWVQRRLTGRSSGDTVEAKRAQPDPVDPSTVALENDHPTGAA